MEKKTIVVVDDFENTLFVVEFTLKNNGYNVLKANNGEEALKLFDGKDIHLLVTDLNMPGMDGIELTNKVRLMEKYKFLPILMLTTETDSKKKELARDASVTGWIQKPFKMEKFLAVIEKCIK
jgi:two-component system chemotaxis response regulator CheY